MTFPRRLSASLTNEEPIDSPTIEKPARTNGLVLDIIEDPSASTALEMERKRELVFQKQQQRQEAFERRRQTREIENLKRDDERRKKDHEESAKKVEREQRRDEIYKQYLMKKEKQSPNNNDHTNGEHPIIKMRPKSSTLPKPPIERRQTGKRKAIGFHFMLLCSIRSNLIVADRLVDRKDLRQTESVVPRRVIRE